MKKHLDWKCRVNASWTILLVPSDISLSISDQQLAMLNGHRTFTINHHLVGGLNPSEKILVNWDDYIPNMWETYKVMFQSPPTSYKSIEFPIVSFPSFHVWKNPADAERLLLRMPFTNPWDPLREIHGNGKSNMGKVQLQNGEISNDHRKTIVWKP